MFEQAKPVWPAGRAEEMNVQVGFRTTIRYGKGSIAELKMTGSTLYRVFVNGTFVHYGPARAAHGFARVDQLNLSDRLQEGDNELAIEVAGYNCPSYYTLDLPSFLQAEVVIDGKVAAATAVESNPDFRALVLQSRVQRAMRYSFQRTFSEVYQLDDQLPEAEWTTSPSLKGVPLEEVPHGLHFLPREVPIPSFPVVQFLSVVEQGHAGKPEQEKALVQHRFIHHIGEWFKGFPLDQIPHRPFEKLQSIAFHATSGHPFAWSDQAQEPLQLHEGEYILLDLGRNHNGFLQTTIEALQDSVVYLLFDEKLINGAIDVRRWQSVNVIELAMKQSNKGYEFESFESYGLRYLQLYVPSGSIRLKRAGIREYASPLDRNTILACADEQLQEIFEAARETYRQNTVDVFMDCPTRERAGWLCDSYFTAQAAALFSGTPVYEKVFLEQFAAVERFPCIPEGMLPMCYPADHPDGIFIPQWAMWYVIELEGYLQRNPEASIEHFRGVLYRLVAYFDPYCNESGLLEKLDKWNFVEWSKANDWVQDVNFPTNMLYCRMLKLIGTWFDDLALLERADSLRRTIVDQSFDGSFFVDNAIRNEDGKLAGTENKSEVCQYYAFFFGVATPDDPRFAPLAKLLMEQFGPDRKSSQAYPVVAYANAFIGNYLRMELLLAWGRHRQALEEVKGYFGHMAALTGTLWEHDRVQGSLNHGFASYAGVVIVRALFGIREWNERTGILYKEDHDQIAIAAQATIGTRFGTIAAQRDGTDRLDAVSFQVPPSVHIQTVKGSL